MNTQNVSIKIAAQKSSERWGSDPKARLDCVIAEQRSYLAQLCQVWNLQLSQKDEAEEVLRLLSLMSDNVHKEGVLCWERSIRWFRSMSCSRGYRLKIMPSAYTG